MALLPPVDTGEGVVTALERQEALGHTSNNTETVHTLGGLAGLKTLGEKEKRTGPADAEAAIPEGQQDNRQRADLETAPPLGGLGEELHKSQTPGSGLASLLEMVEVVGGDVALSELGMNEVVPRRCVTGLGIYPKSNGRY